MTLIILLSAFLGSNTTQLKVIVKNVQVRKGNVFVLVYNEEKLVLKKAFVEKDLASSNPQLKFNFVVPQGDYSILAYQDVNGDKKLNLGLFNIPKEPTGFSNNFRPKFSKPKFIDATIKLMQPLATSIIELK